MTDVRPERTGWRDAELSERHRLWGWNCPAVDLDFLMAEYNHGKPVAIVEYKHRRAQKPEITHPTYQTLIALADGYKDGPLPCLIAFYDPDGWRFKVQPINQAAQTAFADLQDGWISEQAFVRRLYLLRKTTLEEKDEEAIRKLADCPF
jgi:hypothetical protein